MRLVWRHRASPISRLAAAGLIGLWLTHAACAGAPSPTESPPPGSANPSPACPEGTIHDIQPQDAIIARLTGKDARIFVECCLEHGPSADAPQFDLVLILSGPDVMGGTVAVIAQGECPVGHKFLGLMEFIHAGEMMKLYQQLPALQAVEHLDLQVLTDLAEAGEPTAAFHVGFVKAVGWGTERDRKGSIAWLRRAAEAGYEPGMLALGMALAGPGVLDEQVLPIGRQRPRDAETDLATACYWLRRLADAGHELSPLAKGIYEDEVKDRLTPAERKSCKSLLQRQRK
jgi:hypothetical protein